MTALSLADVHRYRWLLGMLLVALSSGCFRKVDPDVSVIVCQTNKNCPKGYVCVSPGSPGGCRLVGSETDGGAVDAVGDGVAKPVDGRDAPPKAPDVGNAGGSLQPGSSSDSGGSAAGGSGGSGGATDGSGGTGGPGDSSGAGGTGGDSGGGGATGGSASGGQGGTGGSPDAGPGDPCSSNPCAHGACQASATSYTCDCTGTGYTGTTCQTDIDECATNNGGCDKLTTCTNTPGGRACGLCPNGYSGTGATACVDIDECKTDNGGCDSLTTCTNKPGSYTCGSCPDGYTSNGPTGCVDIDECKTNNGGCDKLTTCTNTPGSRTCGACPKGYTGTGVAGCVDVDECATSNGGCSVNATCSNTAGGHTCACKSGFSGDGLTCTDVNECATGNGGCNTNATCSNTAGSRTCACKAGYSGDGITSCTDVNECLTNNGGCDANATCSNTIGSRTCACKAGFSGDGVTCTNINDCSPNPCKNGGSCVDGISSHTCNCAGVWSGPSCETGTLVVNASAHGKYPNVNWLTPNSGNTTTGYQGVGASLLEYRSYFGFSIPSFSGTISSVTLSLEVVRYDSPDASESFWVYDVETPLATVTSLPSPCGGPGQCDTIFNDLGSGTTYGSFTLNSSSTGTIKSVVLTSAIPVVSNARGSTFTVGITEYTGPGDGGEVVLFNTDTESRVDQLEIKVVP